MDEFVVAWCAGWYAVLQPLLIVLKLEGDITWDWWIVLLPTIIVVLYICYCLIRNRKG